MRPGGFSNKARKQETTGNESIVWKVTVILIFAGIVAACQADAEK
jgi:hypothetical protein